MRPPILKCEDLDGREASLVAHPYHSHRRSAEIEQSALIADAEVMQFSRLEIRVWGAVRVELEPLGDIAATNSRLCGNGAVRQGCGPSLQFSQPDSVGRLARFIINPKSAVVLTGPVHQGLSRCTSLRIATARARAIRITEASRAVASDASCSWLATTTAGCSAFAIWSRTSRRRV